MVIRIMDATYRAQYKNHLSNVVPEIRIQTRSRQELEEVESHLRKIASKPNGLELLWRIKHLSNDGRHLQIITYDGDNGVAGRLTERQLKATNASENPDDHNHVSLMYAFSRIRPDNTNNLGVIGTIKYNLKQGVELDRYGFPTGFNDFKETNFVSLAHELVHAYHLMNGTYFTSDPIATVAIANSSMRQEEDRAVGVGRFIGSRLSENGIRIEHNLPLRAHYLSREQIRKFNTY